VLRPTKSLAQENGGEHANMARLRVRFLTSENLKRLDLNRIDTQINLAIFSF
jgi:hypothetical protein